MWHLNEVIDPYRKCARVGHKVKISIGVLPEQLHYIFTKTEQDATCSRCGVELVIYGWVREKRQGVV